jgi:hypothetical protein
MALRAAHAWLLVLGAMAAVAACNELLDIQPPNHVASDDSGIAEGGDASPPTEASVEAPSSEGGDACTSNLASDPHNCGRSGRDCLDGGCSDGACQPIVVYSLAMGPGGLAASDAGDLYFTSKGDLAGNVYACNASDCSQPTIIAMKQDYPASVAIDSTNVYWVNSGSQMTTDAGTLGSVATCGRAGCSNGVATVLAMGVPEPTDIAVDFQSAYVYWTSATGPVERCSLPSCNGGASTLYVDNGAQEGIALDVANVYWTVPYRGRVMQCSVTGCSNPSPFASGQLYPSKVIVAGQNLFWSNDSLDGGAIMTCPTSGCGDAGPSVFFALPDAWGLAADSKYLYFTQEYAPGRVFACPLAGCSTPIVLATEQDEPGILALDAVSVYWMNMNAVMRVAKP